MFVMSSYVLCLNTTVLLLFTTVVHLLLLLLLLLLVTETFLVYALDITKKEKKEQVVERDKLEREKKVVGVKKCQPYLA